MKVKIELTQEEMSKYIQDGLIRDGLVDVRWIQTEEYLCSGLFAFTDKKEEKEDEQE